MSSLVRFDESSLNSQYAEKSSLGRYKELIRVFPNTLIIFGNRGYYYGFDETAVVLCIWFKYSYHESNGMLVAKGDRLDPIIRKIKSRGYRYIVDEDGKLTFGKGKGFSLPKPLSYYKKHPISIHATKPRFAPYSESYSKNGGGWHDDVWAPGLPSTRFNKR